LTTDLLAAAWGTDPALVADLEPLNVLGIGRPSWWSRAACRTVDDPSIFFPAKGQNAAPALTVCANCPALDSCRAYALDHPEILSGVWGGMSASALRAARRARRRST
jgi:hypothetical protein